jgi:hypothetical protein
MRNEPRWKTFFSSWMQFPGLDRWDAPNEDIEDENPGDEDNEDDAL